MNPKATRAAFGEALLELAEEFPQIVTLDADLSGSVKTAKFAAKNPNRAINLGISEADMIGTAAGMTVRGRIPFACSFAIFVTGRAWEQVRNSIAYPNINVKLIGSHGGIATGPDGSSHQMIEDFGIMRVLPNMQVFCPADETETKQLMRAIVEHDGPCYIRLGRANVPPVHANNYKFEIGKGSILKAGTKVTIFATGHVVHHALEAANRLSESGIDTGVINMCSIKPLDEELVIESSRNAELVVTAEDHNIMGGLGSAVAEVLAEQNFDTRLYRIGLRDQYAESGSTGQLYKKYQLDAAGIEQQVREQVKR